MQDSGKSKELGQAREWARAWGYLSRGSRYGSRRTQSRGGSRTKLIPWCSDEPMTGGTGSQERVGPLPSSPSTVPPSDRPRGCTCRFQFHSLELSLIAAAPIPTQQCTKDSGSTVPGVMTPGVPGPEGRTTQRTMDASCTYVLGPEIHAVGFRWWTLCGPLVDLSWTSPSVSHGPLVDLL